MKHAGAPALRDFSWGRRACKQSAATSVSEQQDTSSSTKFCKRHMAPAASSRMLLQFDSCSLTQSHDISVNPLRSSRQRHIDGMWCLAQVKLSAHHAHLRQGYRSGLRLNSIAINAWLCVPTTATAMTTLPKGSHLVREGKVVGNRCMLRCVMSGQ